MSDGNKATNLRILSEAGFPVPTFFVLPASYANKPAAARTFVEKQIDPKKSYAVRSSGIKEDLPGFSFAGQYYTGLNAKGVEAIMRETKRCYRSIASRTVQAYTKKNNIPTSELSMAVIIQEMVPADFSGVAFSINPMTGNDKEIVIELAPGLGDALVSGRVNPESYTYNWYDETFITYPTLISESLARELVQTVLNIQILFGYPCDVEFAVHDDRIYILQARAITKILYGGIRDEWTTADFRDGGVSSTVCYPFMWSLYEYIWEIAYRDFLNRALLLPKKRMHKLGDMFYGRPYWNVTMAKQAMANVPGYKEREFDNDLGITPTYEGNGVTTSLTPRSLVNAAIILTKNGLHVRNRLTHNAAKQQQLLARYEQRLMAVSDSAQDWKTLVFEDYLDSESTYFWQIFINTVAQSIYKESLLKQVTQGEYLKLLMGLVDISHLRRYRAIWKLSRKKRVTKEDIATFMNEFGYHSDRELDVTYPHFAENPDAIRTLIATTAELPDSFNPDHDAKKQQEVYRATVEKLSPKLRQTITKTRQLLWWREEFRDVSTRFYYLIRRYTLELAGSLTKQGIVEQADDIWYLKITDLRGYIDGEIDATALRTIVRKNKAYYQSFRHFTPENEIGHDFDKSTRRMASDNDLRGIGCSTGSVTGTARVVTDLSHIDEIQPGDILVTKFTDTGWTSKFAILSGVVTEYGGILCHAAIVSREYGIPCVVCAADAMSQIKNGEIITINGETGEIRRGQ